MSLSSCIKTFDFTTLYTNIPHSKLKDRLKELVSVSYKRMASVDTNTLLEEETNLILLKTKKFTSKLSVSFGYEQNYNKRDDFNFTIHCEHSIYM